MTKNLLFASAMFFVAGSFSASAANEVRANAEGESPFIVFSKADELQGYYKQPSMPSRCTVYLATELTVEDQAPFIGCTISAVNVTSGTDGSNFPISKVNAFVTEELNAVPEDKTTSEVSKTPGEVTEIELEKPFTITGEKPIYIGYSFPYSNKTACYFIPTDDITTSENNTLLATTAKVSDAPSYTNLAGEYGSLCISVTIKGDNLPQNLASARRITIDSYIKPETKIGYDLVFVNNGSNDVNSIVVKTVLSDGTEVEQSHDLSKTVAPGKTSNVTISDVPNVQGVRYVNSYVTEVNGVKQVNPKQARGFYASYGEGYDHKVLVEEVTGSGCQFCPGGIVSMESIRDNFPEWIRVSIHCDWFGLDPMTLPQYAGNNFSGILNYFSANPQAIGNRTVDVPMGGKNISKFQQIDDYFKKNATYCNIALDADCNDEDTEVVVNATVDFAIDSDVPHGISFYLVEDNVGPYPQKNGFSGGANGKMEGWEKLGRTVDTIYEDVARYASEYPFIPNSLPGETLKDQKYTYTCHIPLENVSGGKFRVVGFVTNTLTDRVINSAEISICKSGVENVVVDENAPVISVEDGNIVVTGAENVAVYTLDGRCVNCSGLNNGVYIVVADGVSTKVLVK